MRFLLHVQQRIPQSCCHALCCLVSFCWNARPEFVGIFTFIDAYIYTKERDLSYLTSLCEVGISALQVLIRIRACFGRCAPMSRGHRRKIMKSGGSSFVSIGVTQGAAPKMYIIRIIFKHPPTRNRFCMQHAIPARWFIAKVFWKSPLPLLIVLGSCRLVHCGGGLNQSDPRGVMSLKSAREIQININFYQKRFMRAPSFSGKLPGAHIQICSRGDCAPFATAALIAVGLSTGGTFLLTCKAITPNTPAPSA